ncbi:MAG: electron transfer flavoprotein subunit beta/FixA family protein [Desulfarculaceae bacterium]|jgi:electron transfer flavoprotein beta subunit
MKLVVFMKQVPAVSELPWDPKTGRLQRQRASGMMNPACRHALEAALLIKESQGGKIAAISMGPPSAEEILREALALGADWAVLLSDPRLSGADTAATSYSLSLAVREVCPDFDLLLLGSQTTDSETGQVGPHLAEELDLPSVINVEHLSVDNRVLRAQRICDNFLETLETDLPALVTVTTNSHPPRDVTLAGVEYAFSQGDFDILNAEDLKADLEWVGWAGSAGRITRVYSPETGQKADLIKGAPKKCALELLERYGDRLGGLLQKDLRMQK